MDQIYRFDSGRGCRVTNPEEVSCSLVCGTNPDNPERKDCLLIAYNDGSKAITYFVDHRTVGASVKLVKKETEQTEAVTQVMNLITEILETSERKEESLDDSYGSTITIDLEWLFRHFSSDEERRKGLWIIGSFKLTKQSDETDDHFKQRCLSMMKRGDQLSVPITGTPAWHYGVVVGPDQVSHFNPEKMSIYASGKVTQVSLEEFLLERSPLYFKYYLYRRKDLRLEESEEEFNESMYNLIFNNCEHFSTLVVEGKKQSKQVQITTATMLATAVIVAGVAYKLSSSSTAEVDTTSAVCEVEED